MKFIAFYLPQFHSIPENDNEWGKNFTEWTNTKKARPLFWTHYQPREPLNDDYYCLLDRNVMTKQMRLARKYGIDGFCFYHYWFCGKKVLEKPAELLLNNKKADLPFCFSWANEHWTKTWHGAKGEKEVFIRQTYGGKKDWIAHMEYLLDFFRDERYLKINNRPMFLVLNLDKISCAKEMIAVWNEILQQHGFDGLYLVDTLKWNRKKNSVAQATVDFEPIRSINFLEEKQNWMKKVWNDFIKQSKMCEKIQWLNLMINCKYSYKKLEETALESTHGKDEFRGIFVNYDDTPRRNERARIVRGSSPERFGNYLCRTMEKGKQENNNYIFINAWNEWGEGAYLEADKRYGYAYLKKVRDAKGM